MRGAARTATVAGALLALLGFWLVWHYGHRGVMILDHSIAFDGGYRVYLGQTYYKDFYAAYMPGALWVQGLAFRLFGVNFTAMVVPAAILNAIGVALAIRLVWVLLPGAWIPPAVAGLLTAFWFQAPYGAVMHEQLSFFACLVAVWLTVEATVAGGWLVRWSGVGHALMGVVVVVAVLCKQNAGGLAGLLAVGLVVTGALPHWKLLLARLVWLGVGIVAGLVPFLAWVRFVSDWDKFVIHAILTPLSLGGERAPRTASKLIKMLSTWDWAAFPVGAVSGVVWLVAAVAIAFAVRRRDDIGLRLAGVLGPALMVLMSVFRRTALNDEENCLPFIGLALGLALGVVFYLLRGGGGSLIAGSEETELDRKTVARAIAVPMAMLVAGLLLYGYQSVAIRRVHEFDTTARFTEHLTIPGAERVVWGEPTKSGKAVVTRQEFEALYYYLASRKSNFLIHSDATIFYGLLGRTPPQPVLFFLKGHTFRTADIPRLDGEILDGLQRNDVRTIVVEESPFLEVTPALELFPRVGAWFHSEFKMVRKIGMYQLWERVR